MCKHVAAVLYGVGARLDSKPELLFRLRAVNENDLVADIDNVLPLSKQAPAAGKVLETDDMAALFGLDMAGTEQPAEAGPGAFNPAGDKAAVAPAAKVATKRKPGPATRSSDGSDSKAVARKVAPAKQVAQPSTAPKKQGAVQPVSGTRSGRSKPALPGQATRKATLAHKPLQPKPRARLAPVA
jgi:uncharacterized Zn finger protein